MYIRKSRMIEQYKVSFSVNLLEGKLYFNATFCNDEGRTALAGGGCRRQAMAGNASSGEGLHSPTVTLTAFRSLLIVAPSIAPSPFLSSLVCIPHSLLDKKLRMSSAEIYEH